MIAGAIAVSHLKAIDQCMHGAANETIAVVLEEDVVATGQAQVGFLAAAMGFRDLLSQGYDKIIVFGIHSCISRAQLRVVQNAKSLQLP